MAHSSGNTTRLLDVTTGKDALSGRPLVQIPLSEGSQMSLMTFGADGAETADSGSGSTTASYSGFDMGAIPKRMGMSWTFESAHASGGSAVMISNPNGLLEVADITATGGGTGTGSGLTRVGKGSLHLVCTATKIDVGIFTDGSVANTTVNFNRTLETDDETIHSLFMDLTSSRIRLFLPDGQVYENVSANWYNAAGRYCQFESFRAAASGGLATFKSFSVEA